jgi:ABC-2 type transport system permease protein
MIAATLTLAGYSLRRIRGILIGLGLILALFQFLLTQVASYLLTRSAFDQLASLIPEFLRNIAGPSALAFLSFPGIVALGYFHPMIAVATEPTSEVETRFVDLTLARPVTRGQVIVRTAIVLIVAGGLMLVLMSAGTSIGLACCTPIDAPPVPRGVIASLAIGLAAVMACWGGITLAIASLSKRRAVAAAIAGVSALTAYLLDYLARAWDPAAPFGVVSPFHYFDPMAVVGGQPVGIWNVGVLLAIALMGATVGYVMFSRRDI